MAVPGHFLVDWGANPLTASPSYATIDARQISGFSSHRGRDYLTDRTDAGTAQINFNDKTGILDPTNVASPYWPMAQNSPAQFKLLNPFTGTYVPIFTGLTQNMPQTVRYQGAKFNQGSIALVDMFSWLAKREVPPGLDFSVLASPGTYPAGAPPQTTNVSGDTTYAAQTVQDRMYALLADSGFPSALIAINSGNVKDQSTVYSPGAYILACLQDAADSEFPGVANLYVDKSGILQFKGRLARFDPVTFGASVWKVADREGGAPLSPSYALLAADGFTIDNDETWVINNALFTPENILNSDISGTPTSLGSGLFRAGQLIYHPASIAQYGPRPITGLNLITAGHATGSLDPLAETREFGLFYVSNFNGMNVLGTAPEPLVNIPQIKLRPVPLSAPNAEYHWNMICNVEIGDVVELTVATPQGGGFTAVEFFVEGISYELVPGGNTPDVTVTLDLSPQAYWSNEPIGWT